MCMSLGTAQSSSLLRTVFITTSSSKMRCRCLRPERCAHMRALHCTFCPRISMICIGRFLFCKSSRPLGSRFWFQTVLEAENKVKTKQWKVRMRDLKPVPWKILAKIQLFPTTTRLIIHPECDENGNKKTFLPYSQNMIVMLNMTSTLNRAEPVT